MEKSEEATIDVKLFVDKEKKKVLFAESDKDFVDVLFSFLTMPLGTIVRLLGKQSQAGCLDQVYKSVEDLSTDYFQTKACKEMLLAPLNAAFDSCCQLKINIDDTNQPSAVYICRDRFCSAPLSDRAFSSFPDAVCKCGKSMELAGDRPENHGIIAPAGGGFDSVSGVFVNGCFKFIITDDLVVAPASTSLMMSLFERFGVNDPANLEKTILHLDSQMVSNLLQRSLTSMQPITGLYFDIPTGYDDADLNTLSEKLYPEQQNDGDQELGNVKIRVVQTKNNSSVLYAEVSDDFIDLLFGLLSIPLGSIIKAYGHSSFKGSVGNLYKSIDGNTKECIRPECQSLLLPPKSAPFSCCRTSKILQVEESAPKDLQVNACIVCFKIGGFPDLGRCFHQTPYYSRSRKTIFGYHYTYCTDSVKSCKLRELNPKRPNDGSENGEAYLKGGTKEFMVTDDMRILPLSMSSSLQVVREAKVQTGELLEKEITLTKFQVMELQRATLMSRTPLSCVLLPHKKKKKKKRKLDQLVSSLH
ncbi:hypothetical protein EJB05_39463, partial [Eragrostis curvula]